MFNDYQSSFILTGHVNVSHLAQLVTLRHVSKNLERVNVKNTWRGITVIFANQDSFRLEIFNNILELRPPVIN